MAALWIGLVLIVALVAGQEERHHGPEEDERHHHGDRKHERHDWHSEGHIPTYIVTDVCGKTIKIKDHMSAIKLKIDWENTDGHANTECGLNIRGSQGQRLMVKFLKMHFQERECNNYVEIYDGKTKLAATQPLLTKRCGNGLPDDLITSAEDAYVIFHGVNGSEECTFLLMVTPFHYGKCDYNEFECKNARCIDNRLVCNHDNNCGEASDEHALCEYGRHGRYRWWKCVIGGFIGLLIICTIIGVCIRCCRKKHRRPRTSMEKKTPGVFPAISEADKKAIEAGLSANLFLQQTKEVFPINPPSYTAESGVPVFFPPPTVSEYPLTPQTAPPIEEKKEIIA